MGEAPKCRSRISEPAATTRPRTCRGKSGACRAGAYARILHRINGLVLPVRKRLEEGQACLEQTLPANLSGSARVVLGGESRGSDRNLESASALRTMVRRPILRAIKRPAAISS